MVKKIAFIHPLYGGLVISGPNYGGLSRQRHATDDEFCEHVAQRNLRNAYHQKHGVYPDSPFVAGVDYHIIEEEEIPDELFHSAWEWVDGIVTNMPKARVIHMDRIRLARNAELIAKDVTFMRAVEAGDTDAQARIATEKQVLRDIPATFDITTGVTTPELLHAKWPAELPARE